MILRYYIIVHLGQMARVSIFVLICADKCEYVVVCSLIVLNLDQCDQSRREFRTNAQRLCGRYELSREPDLSHRQVCVLFQGHQKRP